MLLETLDTIVLVTVLLIYNISSFMFTKRAISENAIPEAVKVKADEEGGADATSYSRVAGMLGAVVMATFFWAVGNVVLFKMMTAPAEVEAMLTGVSTFFLAGATLYAPYAVNQLKEAFKS